MTRGARGALAATAAAAALMAGATGCRRGGAGIWHGCNLAASPDGSAFAYVDDQAAVLLRDGKRFAVTHASSPCLAHGRDVGVTGIVAVLPDGWRAIVIGETTDSSFADPHPQFETTVACIVDFRAGTAVDLAAEVPTELGLTKDIRHRSVRIGGRSGRVYTWTGFGPPAIYDPARRAVAKLDGLEVPLANECEVAEQGQTAVLACMRYRLRDDGGYDGFVQVARMDLASWPPVPVVTEIVAPAPPDGVAVSPDATRVAYWKNVLGGGLEYLRVSALAHPDAAPLSITALTGRVAAVAFAGDRIYVAETTSDIRGRESGRLHVLAADGRELASAPLSEPAHALYPVAPRMLVDRGCDAQWIDPPGV